MNLKNNFLVKNYIWTLIPANLQTKKSYKITVPYEEFIEWANQRSKQTNISGFRQGKAPINMFKNDWIESCIKKISTEIIDTDDLQNIWHVTYRIDNFPHDNHHEHDTCDHHEHSCVDIILELSFNFYPQLPLINFNEITLIHHSAVIEKEDIEKAMQHWRFTHFLPVKLDQNRTICMHDFINITIDSEDQSNTINYQIGSKIFVPEIEENLIGKNINDAVNHVMQQDNNNKKIVKITINKIQGSRNYDLNDMQKEFEVNSIKELEEKFAAMLKIETTQISEYLMQEELKQALLKYYFEVPQEFVFDKYQKLRKQLLLDIGYNPKDDLISIENLIKEKMNLTIDEFDKRTIVLAEALARLSFLLTHYAREFKINVKNEEIDNAIAKRSGHFQNGLQEAVKFFAENKEEKDNLVQNLIEEKTLNMISQRCVLENKEHKIEDFYKLKSANFNTNQMYNYYNTDHKNEKEI